jgi:uncharacterized protein YxeA
MPFLNLINTTMKKILKQYLYIFLTVLLLLSVTLILSNNEPNPLVELEEKIKKVEQKEIVLTPNEKELEKEANEKDWNEVDKNTTK